MGCEAEGCEGGREAKFEGERRIGFDLKRPRVLFAL